MSITKINLFKLFQQSHKYLKCFKNLEKNKRFFSHLSVASARRKYCFYQNIRWNTSLANKLVPEPDFNRFIKSIIEAYNDKDYDGELNNILQTWEIKRLISDRMKLLENIESLKELDEEDKEMANLVEAEKKVYNEELKKLDENILDCVYNSLGADNCDEIIMEINAGVGGQEAMLFVKDLLEMYTKHFDYLGFNYSIIEVEKALLGGIKKVAIIVSAKKAMEILRHEAGVHRVQRIPTTEKTGRIHTSAVSVAILPQPTDIEVSLDPKDLKIDTYRSSGAGGQNVNKVESAVRITHIPTGIVTDCQTDRSQIKNKAGAMAKLKNLIYQKQLESQQNRTGKIRKEQMGLGLRNEKIRTYNFNQDRITDHRLENGTVYNLENFMEGGAKLQNFHEQLQEELKRKLFLDLIKQVK